MKFLITGDFVINQPYNTPQISEEVKELFAQSDYNIVNLEAPVTNSESKIIKTGPHLKSDKKSTIEVLKDLNIDLCTLANNHVLDYDEQGVLDTLNFCQEHNIQTVGAGKNKEEAAKVFYLDSDVGKVAIINIAENEWASATDTTAGANGMDLIDDIKTIQEAKSQSDFVFVIVHGGHEYYNLPSPRMQKQYRFYVDNGADIVVGHHTHCISGMEIYKDKPIYYSLGNFLFTKSSRYDDWYRGIVLEVEVSKTKNIVTREVFVEQSKNDFKLSLIKGEELEEIQERFEVFSNNIVDSEKLVTKWTNYILDKSNLYDNYWSPLSFIKNKWIQKIATRLQIKGDNKKGKALALNLMRCEAHYDMSKEVLVKILKEYDSDTLPARK